jgi:hypothetical protein
MLVSNTGYVRESPFNLALLIIDTLVGRHGKS